MSEKRKQKALWKRSKEELLLMIRDLTVENEELSEKLALEESKPPRREVDLGPIDRICTSIEQLRLTIENRTGRIAEETGAEAKDA